MEFQKKSTCTELPGKTQPTPHWFDAVYFHDCVISVRRQKPNWSAPRNKRNIFLTDWEVCQKKSWPLWKTAALLNLHLQGSTAILALDNKLSCFKQIFNYNKISSLTPLRTFMYLLFEASGLKLFKSKYKFVAWQYQRFVVHVSEESPLE